MTRIRVVLDGPTVGPTPAGPGVHLSRLLPAVLDSTTAVDLVLRRVTLRHPGQALSEARSMHPRLRRRLIPAPAARLRRLQRVVGAPTERLLCGRFDVYHQLHADADPLVPSARLIVTLHDTVALHWPEEEGQMYPGAGDLLRRAAAVITVSDFSRGAILDAFGLAPDRVHVVPNGVDHARMNPGAASLSCPLGGRPYLLYVGGGTPRKNVPTLVEAFAQVHREFPDLLLALAGPVCAQAASLGQLLPSGAQSRLLPLGYVSDRRLPGLYAHATAVVLPSLYEGFGLPALEAMACGTRVVCSTAGALPEVCGEAGVAVEPSSAESIAEGLRIVLGEGSATRQESVLVGTRRAARFDWAHVARATVDLYRSVACAAEAPTRNRNDSHA